MKRRLIDIFAGIPHPDEGRDLVRADRVRSLEVQEDKISFTILVNDPSSTKAKELTESLSKQIKGEFGESLSVEIDLDSEMISLGADVMGGGAQTGVDLGRTRILAVASGKGGVGKSTVSVNLATALANQGYRVGLVDTDIYGPSIPTMFGVEAERPRVNDKRKIIPIEKHGVHLLSMGFLADQDQAVIWRGPMVSNAVRQFLGDADWGDLDILVLDFPPGTGDIQLTIVQSVALTGAIVVSTPQTVALADARRGVAMFNNVNVPVLGIIENMAYFTPPDLPDRKYYLFGKGGAKKLADELGVPLLGEIPIEQRLRESGDEGVPLVVQNEESSGVRILDGIASEVATELAILSASRPASDSISISYK